jgi:putative FmdB family regulatory protein
MIYEYKCVDCDAILEKFIDSVDARRDEQVCTQCDGVAEFIISATPFHLDGTDPGFPDAYDRWAREHEKAGAKNA